MDNVDDIKEGQLGKSYDDPSDQLWSLYISKAEKFDKALVESWKGDMDGILIFAGLFSASVTAFIVESYKKLSPDSGDATVTLLAQISSQLVAISNGTNLNLSSPHPAQLPFHPTSSVVAVNILWFLSLALALLCALSATLVEQWARNYMQLIERRPAPNKRARIRAYMYEGVKKFGMTAVVEAIPTLLHVSLFLFIIGLVIFLFPIDLRVALVMLIVLAIVIILYTTLTFLPIRHKNCPYQTPLSSTCWNIIQRFNLLRYRNDNYRGYIPIRGRSMGDGRAVVAMAPLPKLSQRDVAALDWTLEYAIGYTELEHFFDAVPAFYRPSARNADHVLGSLGSSVFNRAGPILDECRMQTDVKDPIRRRRAMACMTALQVVAPKLPSIQMKMFTVLWANTLEALHHDGEATIATLAMCTTTTLASAYLFHIAESVPSKSTVSDSDAADEQLLMKISDQLPVDDLAASMTVPEYLHEPIVTSNPSDETINYALRILKCDDVMDAADRYLKRCKASASREINAFFLANPNFYNFDAEGLTRHLDWINRSIIHDAEISVHYLHNPSTSSENWSTHRAVWAMSAMLRSLRTKKMREEFWNCGRLTIINTLISQLMQCQHDTRGHSSFLLETLRRVIGSSLSPNDADLDSQTKFIRLVEDAISHSPHPHPLAFPVVENLLSVFDELDHPASIKLALDAIERNQWLLDNGFPLENTVQRLRSKLPELTDRNSSNDPD